MNNSQAPTVDLHALADAVAQHMQSGHPQPLGAGPPASAAGSLLVPKMNQALACQGVLIPVEYRFQAGSGQVRTAAYLMFDGNYATHLPELAERLKECGFRVRGQFDREDGGYQGGGGYQGRDNYRGNNQGNYGRRY